MVFAIPRKKEHCTAIPSVPFSSLYFSVRVSTRREFLREILYKIIAILPYSMVKFILLIPLAIFPILLGEIHSSPSGKFPYTHGKNFMSIFTTLSVVIWFYTSTLGLYATFVYVFTMRVVIYDILSVAIIPTLSTSTLFCNLCYILSWISPHSVVKIAIRI